MLTNRGEKWPKWGTNQLRERSGSQTNAIANLASSNASVDYRNRGHSQATETNLSNHLFYRKKLFSAIGKCREILVTVHNTTGSIYTTTQRHEGLPACRESKMKPIQRRFRLSWASHSSASVHQTIKCDSSAFFPAALGAEFPTPRINSQLARA